MRPRVFTILSRAGLAGAVVAALAAVASGFGYRYGLWPLGAAFALLRTAAWAGLIAGAAALISLSFARGAGWRGIALALAGVVIGGVTFAVPALRVQAAQGLPPIHDITTDPGDPPSLEPLLSLRAGAPNPPDYPGAEAARLQRAAYPDIAPLVLPVPPVAAYNRAFGAAEAMGWRIVAADAQARHIAAVATSFWFGFHDDVVVRIRPDSAGSRIDVRSVSRVGRGDFGVNARRIRDYLDRLRE